jgi:lysophospholipid acyltransferase (LPLAT)-like uncharacterized protein
MLKRLMRRPAAQEVAAWLLAAWLRLVHATTRWRFTNLDAATALWAANEPFILAFWHERLPLLAGHALGAQPNRPPVPVHVIISAHRDGRLIARVIGHFGLGSVAGSSTRGGAGALRGLLRLLASGACVAITPDGPRGPRRVAEPGVVALAQLSGRAVLCVGASTSRHHRLRSWDRTMLPLPFARGMVVLAEPIHVPRDADAAAQAALLSRITATLSACCDQADLALGLAPG